MNYSPPLSLEFQVKVCVHFQFISANSEWIRLKLETLVSYQHQHHYVRYRWWVLQPLHTNNPGVCLPFKKFSVFFYSFLLFEGWRVPPSHAVSLHPHFTFFCDLAHSGWIYMTLIMHNYLALHYPDYVRIQSFLRWPF